MPPRGLHGAGLRQVCDDLVIAHLTEVAIERPDGKEPCRRGEADHLVHLGSQPLDGIGWRHRRRQHQPPGSGAAGGVQRRLHGGAGGDSVVHHDRRAPADRHPGAAGEVELAAPLDLRELAGALLLEVARGDLQLAQDLLVEHGLGAIAVDHGADRELGLQRRPDLAHQHQIERRAERTGNLQPDRHAAAGQRKDHRVLLLELKQAIGKAPPGFAAIGKQNLAPRHVTSLQSGFPLLLRPPKMVPRTTRSPRGTAGRRPLRLAIGSCDDPLCHSSTFRR
jgi:hypothetical protein